jgi:hypothetical protein
MFTKKETQKVIDKYAKKYLRDLGLSGWKVSFHVYKSDSKKLKDMRVRKEYRAHNFGVSFIGDKCADVILFYDMFPNQKECITTLIHELLHLRMAKLVGLVTIKMDTANRVEEKTVRDIERLIAGFIK